MKARPGRITTMKDSRYLWRRKLGAPHGRSPVWSRRYANLYSYDYYIPHILLADRPQVPVGVYQTRLGQSSYYGAYDTGWTSDSRRARDFLAEVSSLLPSGKHSCFPGGKLPGREVYRRPYMDPRLKTSGAIPPQPLMFSWRAEEPQVYSTYTADYHHRKAKHDCPISISETVIRERSKNENLFIPISLN